MNIINVSKYEYPEESLRLWKEQTFTPLHDLKLQIELDDGNRIECAAFRMIIDGKIEEHACISTQVGCKYGCKFCTSGKNGFIRNLNSLEMYAQLKLLTGAEEINKFDCIVFMGIGEPLDNYDELVKTLSSLLEKKDLYSGIRPMGIATNGSHHKELIALAKSKIPVEVWISLHAIFDEKRNVLMPINKKYSIHDVLTSAEEYSNISGEKAWINYMIFKGFNDTDEDAQNLIKLLGEKVNNFGLILTQPNNDVGNLIKAEYEDLVIFEKKLKSFSMKNDIVKFITAGKKIGAGCGEFIFVPAQGEL